MSLQIFTVKVCQLCHILEAFQIKNIRYFYEAHIFVEIYASICVYLYTGTHACMCAKQKLRNIIKLLWPCSISLKPQILVLNTETSFKTTLALSKTSSFSHLHREDVDSEVYLLWAPHSAKRSLTSSSVEIQSMQIFY